MSATVIARTVAATPKRSAAATWDLIVDILAPDKSDPARDELKKVSGVASSIISAEAPTADPIVLFGGGARVRVYCIYNDDAILGEKASEDPVRQDVTGPGWELSLPCEEDDLGWVSRQLRALSSKVTARKLGDDVPESESDETKSASRGSTAVDLAEFFKS